LAVGSLKPSLVSEESKPGTSPSDSNVFTLLWPVW
jgi:hypothetical protein